MKSKLSKECKVMYDIFKNVAERKMKRGLSRKKACDEIRAQLTLQHKIRSDEVS